jgi:predicted nuclease of predicted toxin-antitoxin system
MRLKLDENLPTILVEDLGALGHDVDTATSEGLAGHDDSEVWSGAQGAGRMLLTQDLDFSDVRVFAPGTHPGLVLLRMREPGLSALRTRVLAVFRAEPVEAWTGCLVVVTDRKVRVRRPRPT